ncbi:hypothetical protein KJ766_03395 [Patescibacteria group bacterium]|nr:hypothetical protein [Patescibacteria group bacterium]
MVLDPEYREQRESFFEQKRFSPEAKKKLLKALNSGKETFADIIQCPNEFCQNPLKVEVKKDSIRVSCTNCGWEQIIKRSE